MCNFSLSQLIVTLIVTYRAAYSLHTRLLPPLPSRAVCVCVTCLIDKNMNWPLVVPSHSSLTSVTELRRSTRTQKHKQFRAPPPFLHPIQSFLRVREGGEDPVEGGSIALSYVIFCHGHLHQCSAVKRENRAVFSGGTAIFHLAIAVWATSNRRTR